MKAYALTHLSDFVLLRDLASLVARDRVTTAALLAHIAEVDARRLYLPAAYASMHAYCVQELRLSEDAASKRIQASRVARRFPVIFELLAEGRLHLSGVCLLAPHLTEGNAQDLIEAAVHKTKSEIDHLVAARFPRTELLEWVQVIPAQVGSPAQHAPGHVDECVPGQVGTSTSQHAPGHVETVPSRAKLAPIAGDRYALQVTVDQGTYNDLLSAQALLGHQLPSGDLSIVLGMALKSLVRELERRKFAASDRPQRQPRASNGARTIPAHVKREVWERDQGQCTFESETGQRCPARTRIEFDHIDEVARGGEATTDRMRLRCRAHNQYTAECAFGAGFMERKRAAAQAAAAAARDTTTRGGSTQARAAKARTAATARDQARAEEERVDDRNVIPWLRRLGYRADEARRAAKRCESIPDASLEQRVRVALGHFQGPLSSTG